MAARLLKHQSENCRLKIQTSQLINRLQDHANGKVELSPTQVRAAEVLLKKALPDLASVQHTGEGGGPIIMTWQQ